MMDRLLIMKDDSAVGFQTRGCTSDNLKATVFQAIFCTDFAEEHEEEVDAIIAGLHADGRVDFEDGWIELRNGMQAVVEFFMVQIAEARDEAAWEDQRRFEELKARQAAVQRYETLRDALALAIGNGAKAANLRYQVEKAL